MKYSDYTLNGLFSFIQRSSLITIVVVPLLIVGNSAVSFSQEATVSSASSPENEEQDSFEYVIEDRKDPFVPFITGRATTSKVNPDEIVEPKKEELTGMQLFEPGQLTLVALMKKGDKDFAMVEDTTGKGYVITEGTKIGRRGVVKDIAPNQVIIEETAQTRAGRKIVSKVVMVLKKEGEE